MKFKVILEEADEGGYVVYVPALPGCVSQGETREEALRNIKEAIEVYLDVDDAEIEAEIKGKKAEVVEITLWSSIFNPLIIGEPSEASGGVW